jgi:formylglycine-generating enzyme required for sulfatase activity/nucleoside phosphorylase
MLKPGNLLIVTVTKVEAQAVLDTFTPEKTWTRERLGSKFYYFLGLHGGVPVYMVQSEMGTATPGGSLLTVRRAIQDLHPRALIMCGIAFGTRPASQQLGEILVSRQLEYYEPQKVDLNQGLISRGDRVSVSDSLLDRFRSGDLDWQGVKIHFGLVLSGEKLVNNPAFLDGLLTIAPEAIGGEMEGAGLYAAAQDAKTDWILVKAICDWADGGKNSAAQTLAAGNAARFVLHVLQLGGWEGSEQVDSPFPIHTGILHPSSPGKPVSVPKGGTSQELTYELSHMLEGMLRNDAAFREERLHLAEREPEPDGWFHTEIHKELLRRLGDPTCPARGRVRAGVVLAQLGDPRFRSDAWFLPEDDFLGFIEIPAGTFLMGNANPASDREVERESPQHSLDLAGFYINRFPVTNAQYWAFLRETSTNAPMDPSLSGMANRPVVSVSWQDAALYCSWLTDRLRKWPGAPKKIARILSAQELGSGWVVSLPSEAEWEKAARGSLDARLYPWGSQPDPERANYKAAGLGETSPVGSFASGQSLFGIQELSGNVMEWTRSNWGSNMEIPRYKYPYRPEDGREDLRMDSHVLRVLRGGSFLDRPVEIRCSHRSAELPNTKCDYLGFRLAITRLVQ